MSFSETSQVVTGFRYSHPRHQTKPKAVIALLDEWLQDESGYDEETWPELKGPRPRSVIGEEALRCLESSCSIPGRSAWFLIPDRIETSSSGSGTSCNPGAEILVPEIADYEVRRELLRARKTKGIKRLDELKRTMGYVPITTEAMLKAAEFWAIARRRGRPTAKDEALDGDVNPRRAGCHTGRRLDELVIATTNVKHLSRFASAEIWSDIQ